VGTKTVNTWLNENTLTYTKRLGKHNITALAGFTQQGYKNESAIASAQGFVSDLLSYNNLSSGSAEWALRSFLGRINYSYLQKYYFTVTARADGSSRFGDNKKWGYFPSAAFAWSIGKEQFLLGSKVISNLKLRLSAGITGNQEIGQYQSLATLTNNGYLFGNALSVGFYPNRIANPDLGWEKTTQYDAGIDLGLLKNRISITLDAYYKRTSDLLLTVPIPYTTGYTSSLQNYGTADNKGIDLGINSQNINSKDFSWNTNLVFSLNRNKVISLGDGVGYLISDPVIAQVGKPLGSFYGYKANGIFQTGDDISKLPSIDPNTTKPGDRKYADINGDGVITQAGDRTIIGNAQPKFIAGITNNFVYKDFDFSFFFYGSYGNQLFNQNKQQLELFSGQQNAATTALDRWTVTNPSNDVQRAKEDPAPVTTSRYVEDASYLRLKTLTVGYTLPQKISNLVHIKQIRFYASANNLVTWTKYSGYDPDVSKNEQTTLTQGIDYGAYPNAKSFQAGLSVTF
jgi:TonB-linked SusC/RagA family outer membrane protein